MDHGAWAMCPDRFDVGQSDGENPPIPIYHQWRRKEISRHFHFQQNTAFNSYINKKNYSGNEGQKSCYHDVGHLFGGRGALNLHASLESSQAISSLKQSKKPLNTMCNVILPTCDDSTTNTAIAVHRGSVAWYVAASGDPRRELPHKSALSLAKTSLTAENAVLYCTYGFRGTVFSTDIVSDKRFSNVNETWL